jgi:sigma-B regulation protein RsbU (phosphoserine phosphatase)
MRILVADDQAGVLDAARLLLKSEGHSSITADSPQAVMRLTTQSEFDVILMDLNYARDTTSGREGLDLLANLRSSGVQSSVVVMTAWGSVDLAVEAMRRGASDFVQKPWDNARLLETIAKQGIEARRTRSDLDIAQRVQRRLLPRTEPRVEGLDFAARCVPARGVGGDYYDWFELGQAQTGFLLADVSGKGIGAALLMAHLQGAVRTRLSMGYSDAIMLLEAVNRQFWESSPPEQYATLFFARYDPRECRLYYVNAGHQPALVVRRNGCVERLGSTALALGMFAQWTAEETAIELTPGDTVVIVSDGVPEAGIDSGEEFGEARLTAVLKSVNGDPAALVVDRVCERVAAWSPHDDYTVMALRCVRSY